MGGGDLNLKKSWHPHTLKNQERVWKAEQQKAAEDRKMAELQRELKEERDREMLRRTAEDSGAVERKGDEKLDWMYKGPGGHVSREEYLLGRKIDKAFEQLDQTETEEKTGSNNDGEASQQNKPVYTIEHEINPESVVRRDPANIQVDMRRKLLEDPLLLIRQREEQAKREITSNPVKMKHLQQLISAIKSKKKKKRKKKHSKHASSSSSSSSSSESDSEDDRSRKRKKNKSRKKTATSSDSSSSSSSSDSSEERKRKKKKAKKKKSHKKHKEGREKQHNNSELEEKTKNKRDNITTEERIGKFVGSIKRNSEQYRSQKHEDYNHDGRENDRRREGFQKEDRNSEKNRLREHGEERLRNLGRNDRHYRRNEDRYGGDRYRHPRSHRRSRSQSRSLSRSRSRERGRYGEELKGSDRDKTKQKLTESEMEKMRQEMMAAARKRDEDRKENVKRYEEERRREEQMEKDVGKFRRGHLLHAASGSTVEDRVKSRVSSVQRGSSHMETNFARK